jgi:hypothetical protein
MDFSKAIASIFVPAPAWIVNKYRPSKCLKINKKPGPPLFTAQTGPPALAKNEN